MANYLGNFGSAATDLGLGGDLSRQVQDETDEERKKRLRLMQQQSGPGSALGAVTDLFGGGGARGTVISY